ncbi:hypothetical protein CLV62_10470 [Dysgonomonas alginatilytica]|uniref:Uncharacterized protein n=1 Tax=Dysgonomonas alginatilytica TaxID=1605892 RepID=A0A2V3PR49_9BACT|nr:hypothetical protein CLV62_10470 [Dysgonomonas alginatilytica]
MKKNMSKQKDERKERILYVVFIIMLIISFFSTCIKPLFIKDKDPEKTEYEINSRLRLN